MSRVARRGFLQKSSAAMAGLLILKDRSDAVLAAGARKMTIDLRPGSIGVRGVSLEELIGLAHAHGFESVAPNAQQLVRLSDSQVKELQILLGSRRLVWGAAGLSVDFRGEDAKYQAGMKQLPTLAACLQRVGVTRVGTWLKPCHDALTYEQNLDQHARRLRKVARVLGDHGLRFGLEYVGPKTSWTAKRYPFVHTMAQTKELIAAIGADNVGFVLDSWHWYTAHETVADLRTLTSRDIVAVDLNDAPAGIAIDEQVDSRRELPMATGVIDLGAFLNTLNDLGYDGPVRAEPFNKELNSLPNEAAVAATAAAMKKAFALIR